mmetsp:Transcript_33299/g.94346  ORF Transcript_33299/g.94346 Transcript_33299/m.94346 type:complete len:1641 (+) Transcript_33299:88-5010(+)|eukprot:CAMPEP_0117666034 /NCGR_PEP_ID=MMETSP0804-20121206/10144_1 /TAXON_ID=1074897 /ORGANISM="Tetraselmis astigmatica, Strain CCMP880" /LENGTH=1640 /DNA_ID=CAMNT_0005473519 /DNA_START=65 /DNA_END=4987 /DNA_ORIENTATION=+
MVKNTAGAWEDEGSDASYAYDALPVRRPVKYAWMGGTKVDEENFLKMQEDYLRVMTQYNDGEKQRRQLTAKLARAEEAAKRLLADRQAGGMTGGATAKGNAAAAGRRMFELEGELSEVKDENTQLRHKIARERKANEVLRERNKTLDQQVRKALADYQRLLRQMKNPKNARNTRPSTVGGRGGKAANRGPTVEEEEMRLRYVEQQEELADLQEENNYLRQRLESEGIDLDDSNVAILRQQVDELRRQLAESQAQTLIGGGRPEAASMQQTGTGRSSLPGSPQKSRKHGDQWELHEIEYEGQVYLLDPKTKSVFSRPSQSTQWPHPVGRMVSTDPMEIEFRHQRQIGEDFYTQLDAYLKGERKKLKEVFNMFDADQSGALERSEMNTLVKQLVPSATATDMRYVVAMLDADSDGAVTWDELMDSITDVVHAGQALKDAQSLEGMQVLERLRDLISTRGQEVEDLFRHADRDNSGSLDFVEVGQLLRKLMPSLSSQEMRFLVAAMYKWDVNGSGTISLPELKQALQIGSWTSPSGPLSPTRRPGSAAFGNPHGSALERLQTSLTGQQFQNDMNRLHAENLELKQQVAIFTQQTAEVSTLRRDLEEAKLEAATAEDHWLRTDATNLRRSVGKDISAELKDAWNKVKELRQRWLDAKAGLDSLRADYTTVVNKLDEVHRQLNEERKARFRMEKDKEFWRIESTKYRELEPELHKAREKVVELEKENRQAFANIFNAPDGAVEELRHLKTELLEVRKAKADAEAREADARKQLAHLRGIYASARPGEVPELRAENQRLERELSKAKVDLEAVMARLNIYDRTTGDDAMPESLNSPREGGEGDGGTRPPRGGADVYRELQDLRNVWHEDKTELDKVRKLLEHEEERSLALQAQVEELRSYYEGSLKDRERKLADTGRLGHRQVERLEERIRKLEAQLRNAYSQGWKKGGVRSSVANGSIAVDLDEELADLEPDENIFELHLASAVLDEDAMGRNPPTFLSLDFFEHETQATSVVSSGVPEYDHTIQYILKADTFFVEYLDTRMLVIELNRSKGWDFETVGTARIPLQQCLDDFRLGAGVGRNRQYHYTDICGPGGRYLGRLRWSAGILKPIDRALRDYRMATSAKRASAPHDLMVDEHPAARALALAVEDPSAASHLRVVVKGCRGLKPNVPPADSTPYVGYTFPGMENPHYSTFGKGTSPVFEDEAVFQIVRTRELETFFSRFELEFEVYDDAERSTSDSSIIGVASVRLNELIEGLPVEGYVPLYSAQGRQRRGEVEVLIHWYNPLVVAQPPGGGDREERRRPQTGDTVRVSMDRPGGRTGRGPSFKLTAQDQSLSRLANQGRERVDDSDELQSIDGRSEKSDTRLEGQELSLQPSQHCARTRQEKGVAAAAPGQESTATKGPREADLHRRSLSKRMSTSSMRRDKPSTRRSQHSIGEDIHVDRSGSRYSQLDDSLAEATEALPLVRDVSNRLPDQWGDLADNHIIISIESVRLGAEVFHDPRVQSVFVMYEFLPEYVSPEDQVTFTHPKTKMRMEFNFSTAIRCGKTPELHRQARYAIGEMMRREAEDAYIPICLVSDKEDDDEDYHEFGFAEINLHSVLRQGDMYHQEIDVLGQNSNEVVATLTLSVIAQKALHSILEDTAP